MLTGFQEATLVAAAPRASSEPGFAAIEYLGNFTIFIAHGNHIYHIGLRKSSLFVRFENKIFFFSPSRVPQKQGTRTR